MGYYRMGFCLLCFALRSSHGPSVAAEALLRARDGGRVPEAAPEALLFYGPYIHQIECPSLVHQTYKSRYRLRGGRGGVSDPPQCNHNVFWVIFFLLRMAFFIGCQTALFSDHWSYRGFLWTLGFFFFKKKPDLQL